MVRICIVSVTAWGAVQNVIQIISRDASEFRLSKLMVEVQASLLETRSSLYCT